MITVHKPEDGHKHFLHITEEPIADAYARGENVLIKVGDTEIKLMRAALIKDKATGVCIAPAQLRGQTIKMLTQGEEKIDLALADGRAYLLTAERIRFFRDTTAPKP